MQVALAGAFAGAASRYWLGVFPLVRRELHHWRERAERIPDPALRALALRTQAAERGNLEGAAAYAVLAPRAYRARVVRATIAFQATYDYVDTLVEQPSADPLANGRRLHLALLTALDPHAEHCDYYANCAYGLDDGYMRAAIDACRRAFASLPSHTAAAAPAQAAARRMIVFQTLNHGADGRGALASWAATVTPAGTGLRWWETAAATASSLGVFALIAAAAHPRFGAREAQAMERAYFPWIGALHVLLDSLVDRAQDMEEGQHCLVDHYSSIEEAARRLGAIAGQSMQATRLLPGGIQHAIILAAMTSFYLSSPSRSGPGATQAARPILDAMGALAAPTMAVLRARRAADRLLRARPRTRPQAPRVSCRTAAHAGHDQ